MKLKNKFIVLFLLPINLCYTNIFSGDRDIECKLLIDRGTQIFEKNNTCYVKVKLIPFILNGKEILYKDSSDVSIPLEAICTVINNIITNSKEAGDHIILETDKCKIDCTLLPLKETTYKDVLESPFKQFLIERDNKILEEERRKASKNLKRAISKL